MQTDNLETLIIRDSIYKVLNQPQLQWWEQSKLDSLLLHKTNFQEYSYQYFMQPAVLYYLEIITTQLSITNSVQADYHHIHNFFLSIEKVIAVDAQLQPQQRDDLLVYCSLLRHASFLNRKKPKKNTDSEWDLLIILGIGATEGLSQQQWIQAVTGALQLQVYAESK